MNNYDTSLSASATKHPQVWLVSLISFIIPTILIVGVTYVAGPLISLVSKGLAESMVLFSLIYYFPPVPIAITYFATSMFIEARYGAGAASRKRVLVWSIAWPLIALLPFAVWTSWGTW